VTDTPRAIEYAALLDRFVRAALVEKGGKVLTGRGAMGVITSVRDIGVGVALTFDTGRNVVFDIDDVKFGTQLELAIEIRRST
jgi:hypothetical protein